MWLRAPGMWLRAPKDVVKSSLEICEGKESLENTDASPLDWPIILDPVKITTTHDT